MCPPLHALQVALVSYRHVPVASDNFTLDETAMVSLVDTAARAGVSDLWLDQWSYRMDGPYRHAHFVATLSCVVSSVSCVIWLPCSRSGATADYQFRLWCTFEACVVAQRQLSVFIAGHEPTRMQQWLRRLGPRMPWIPGIISPPAEIHHLCLFNTLVMVLCVFAPIPFLPIWFIITSGVSNAALKEFVPHLGQQFALCYNGQRVLACMHASRTDQKKNVGLTYSLIAGLRLELPWLPAYDRRDALTILELLDGLEQFKPNSPQRWTPMEAGEKRVRGAGCDPERHAALALCTYFAALMEPSQVSVWQFTHPTHQTPTGTHQHTPTPTTPTNTPNTPRGMKSPAAACLLGSPSVEPISARLCVPRDTSHFHTSRALDGRSQMAPRYVRRPLLALSSSVGQLRAHTIFAACEGCPRPRSSFSCFAPSSPPSG